MILDTFSICVTVVVLNVHFRSPQTHTMAPCKYYHQYCKEQKNESVLLPFKTNFSRGTTGIYSHTPTTSRHEKAGPGSQKVSLDTKKC